MIFFSNEFFNELMRYPEEWFRTLLGMFFCLPKRNQHRLRRGLPGYLILFAPRAFAPQRQ